MATLCKQAEGRLVGRDVAPCPDFNTWCFWCLNIAQDHHTCWACELEFAWAGTVHDVIVRVPKRAGCLTRGSRKLKGLCTLKLPREAHFEVNFCNWVFRAWALVFPSISSCFQGKILQFLYFLHYFELWNRFPKVLRSFELVLTLFYCFLWENDRTLSHWVSRHISVYCVHFLV